MRVCLAGREEGLDKTSGPAGLARAMRRYTEAVVTVVDGGGDAKTTTGEKMGEGGREGSLMADDSPPAFSGHLPYTHHNNKIIFRLPTIHLHGERSAKTWPIRIERPVYSLC